MKRKFFTILTALALCLTLLPTAVWAEEADAAVQEEGHTHYLCGGDVCTGIGHTCTEKTTFTAWTSNNSLPETGVYYLTQDVTLPAEYDMTVTGDLTLDLNGHSIIGSSNKSTICVKKTGCFTLADCNGSHSTHKFSESKDGGPKWVWDENGSITVDGGVITHGSNSEDSGWGVLVILGGKFTMYGGTVCGNYVSANWGAGVNVNVGTFTMYGGAIKGNAATRGGGVYVNDNTTFTMHGGEISENKAVISGGGVNVGSEYSTAATAAMFTMTGGKISENAATGNSHITTTYGGGVFVDNEAKFEMSGGSIIGCTAQSSGNAYGGGISALGTAKLLGNAVIQNCKVIANLYAYGGGILSSHSITITGNVTVTGCTSNGDANAMYICPSYNDKALIEGGTFDGSVYLDGYNRGNGDNTISVTGGIFNGKVTNLGLIKDGTFKDDVVNMRQMTNSGTINGGTFENTVVNQGGTITAGTFHKTVTNTAMQTEPGDIASGNIVGGVFYGPVLNELYTETYSGQNNKSSNMISGGSFYGLVTNRNIVTGGTFYSGLNNDGNDGKISGLTLTYQIGNTDYAKQIVPSGGTATRPNAPANPGHTLDWYTDEACTQVYDFTQTVTENITLYAHWTINQYTITFDPDNGSGVTSITQDYGTPVTAPEVPVKTGYRFEGWDTEIPATMPAENMTIKAKWTINHYTVAFNTDGGSDVVSQNVAHGEKAQVPDAPTKSGYTFAGWYLGEDEFDFDTAVTQDLTLTAKWTRVSSGGGGGSRNSYAISTSKVDNGTVTINNGSTAKRGDTVSITVKPDAGYELGTVTVTDSKGNNISLTDKGDGKYTFTMPDGKVDVKATFVKAEQPGRTGFVDVLNGVWYEDAANFVAERGLMSGVGENLFGGSQNTTRGMLMTILARLDGQDVTGGATWYEKGMTWAKQSGVSDGTTPTANITREQLATMLYSYAKLKGIDTTQGGMAVREFNDYDSISPWAGQSMTWAVNAGILSGRGSNTLAPTAGATRAEMAVMLQQFVGLMEK